MQKYRPWGLWLRIALPFLLFVVAGSIILCAWLYASASRESRDLFATLARTNADFIRTSHLPASERMAIDLSRILDMQVCFRETAGKTAGKIIPPLTGETPFPAGSLASLKPSAGVMRLGTASEAIAVPIDNTHDLILIRPVRNAAVLLRPFTLIMLLSFWMLSLVLAWTLTRGVVRPLRILALRLPQIEKDDVAALPGTDRNDEIGLLARTYLDTHNQLLAERDRREKAERLALLGKMATGLAHEINNPVSSIRMHVQLMESEKPSGFSADTIPIILGETAKIESLVNQWMFLARPAPPQVSHASLAALVADVVKTLLPHAAHAHVHITTAIPENLTASVDSRRIRQAIGNLIVNAIQAMPTGGKLEITGRTEGLYARLDFQDAGPGFSEAALRHYADLFYSEKEGGMGIGLTVTTEIIKAHHGTLEVKNEPTGARVTLIFPI